MPWQILIVDDEEDVHKVTQLALRKRKWKGSGFELHSAFSGEEARKLLAQHTFHVALVDVVMETDDAGLQLCRFMRTTFPAALRIVLRTGQPGAAPEDVILDTFDIDFYVAKSEATPQQLYKVVRACLRTLEDYEALEAANTQLTVANAELARQAKFRERVLGQLGDGKTGYVAQMLEHSRAIGQAEASEVSRLTGALGDVAERVMELFRPHDFRGHVETTLSDKSVLILLGNHRALRLTQGALAGTMANPYVTTDWTEGLENLRTGNVDLLYVDWQHRGVLNQALQYNPNLMAILMTGQQEFDAHGKEMLDLSAASAVVISPLLATDLDDRAVGVQELVVTAGKLMSGDVFGLEKYLAWGVNVHEETLRRSDERGDAIERLVEFAKQCNIRGSIRRRLATFTDELLMNAMWDAPADAEGNAKYNHLDRSTKLELAADEAVLLRYASDGNQLAVSATDHFGRLARETAFRYVQRCLNRDNEQISRDPGGAGLGLYMAYMAMSSFVINVHPRKKTEVIGFLDLRSSPREMAMRPRTFHYFCARAIRRAHPRKSAKIDVLVELPDGTTLEPTVVRNISLGGLFIQLDRLPRTGTRLWLSLALSLGRNRQPHEIKCVGHVVWTSAEDAEPGMRGVGVQLQGLGPTEMRLVAEYLEQLPGIPEA